MKQFIESLLIFQLVTGRYCPVSKIKNKVARTAIYAAIFSVFFAYQLFDYMHNKEENLYELLELESPYVSSHQIDVGFDKAKKMYDPKENPEHQSRFEKINKAYKCLKRQRCRDQYTRYNLSIDLPDDPNVEIDWRLGFTIVFYAGFAFTQSVLASMEQKPGIRVAMGLGIMFCIDEILILQDISAFIKEGQKSDASVQRILSLFPQSYCTFEVAMLSRIAYFLFFNIVCSVSLTYVLNDDKERVVKSEEMRKNQEKLTELANKIYKMYEDKKLETTSEFTKKEYNDVRQKALVDMAKEMAAIQSGKTREEIESSAQTNKGRAKKIVGSAMVVLMIARWVYTKYQKSQDGETS